MRYVGTQATHLVQRRWLMPLFACVLCGTAPGFAQDRFPRAGEPGAIGKDGSLTSSARRQSAVNPASKKRAPEKRMPSLRADSPATTEPRGNRTEAQRDAKRKVNPVARFESKDFGVQPVKQLHSGPMHGATPRTIPGGRVIGTAALSRVMQAQQTPLFVFHVLGQGPAIPGALYAVQASAPGHFRDPLQQQLSGYLQQLTSGNKRAMLVFYCSGPQCWLSYNAALRAINLGYSNVHWYRGGLRAWQMAGLPLR